MLECTRETCCLITTIYQGSKVTSKKLCFVFEGFVQPSLGFQCSKSILYTDNLSLLW